MADQGIPVADGELIAEARRAVTKVVELDSIPHHARAALRSGADLLASYEVDLATADQGAPSRLKALGSKVRATARELKSEGEGRYPAALEHLADRLEGGAIADLQPDPAEQAERESEEAFASEVEALRTLLHHMEVALDALDADHPWREACAGFAKSLAKTVARYDDPGAEPTAGAGSGDSSSITLSRKERNLLGELAGERLYFLGDELMYTQTAVEKVQRPAQRVARLTHLLDAIGWQAKAKKEKGREWTVPAGVLISAVDALLEEARTEQKAVAIAATEDQKKGHADSERSSRKSEARWAKAIADLLDLRLRVEEGGRS